MSDQVRGWAQVPSGRRNRSLLGSLRAPAPRFGQPPEGEEVVRAGIPGTVQALQHMG